MSHKINILINHFWSFIDAILLVVIGISLAEVHLYLSVIALVVATIYNSLKLIDYCITRKLIKKQKQSENKNSTT